MQQGHLTEQSELGAIRIAPDAIAQIVGHTAAECYGVVGMAGKGLTRLLTRDKLTQGIDVSSTADGLRIDLHVVSSTGSTWPRSRRPSARASATSSSG